MNVEEVMNVTTRYGGISPKRNSTKMTETTNAGVLVVLGFWQNVPFLFVTVICIYFLLIITGIVLNSMVCYVMVKSKRYLKNLSSFFITHLSAVDLVYRVLLTPFVVYLSVPSSSAPSPIPCKISVFASSTCSAAIFGSLVVIAVDRYRNIVHPLTSLKHQRRPFLVGVGVWIYAVASSAMFLHTARYVSLDDLPEAKNIDRVGSPTSCDISPGFLGGLSVTVAVVMTFVVPLATLIITYTAIFVSLRRRCQSGLVHKAAAKSKAKAARMLVIVVIGFVVCFGPSALVVTLRAYGMLDNTPSQTLVVVVLVTTSLEFFSSLFNPLIYAFYSNEFKKDVLKICCIVKVKCPLWQRLRVQQVPKDGSTTRNIRATSTV